MPGLRSQISRSLNAFLWSAVLTASLPAQELRAPELAPTGTLRAVFLGLNPVQGKVDAKTGEASGPVPDLVRELARRLHVPYTLWPAANAREVMDRVKDNSADIGFLAFDPPRAVEVDFSVPYLLMGNAYVVRSDSKIARSADVDKAGVRIGAVKGQTQEIYLNDTFKSAQVKVFSTMPPQAELEQLIATNQIDGFALNRQRAEDAEAQSSKLRALPDNFLEAEQDIILTKRDPARLAAINQFIRDVLVSGFVKESLGRAKIAGVDVARPR